MSKFKLYVLDGCPFCKRALDRIKSLGLDHESIIISHEQKEKYKIKHEMETFPQIFFIDNTNKNKTEYKIGGCDELETLLDIVKTIGEKYNIKIVEKIINIIKNKE